MPKIKKMKVGVFVQCFNEEWMLPWFVRFYRTMFRDCTICVMDNESTDRTHEVAKELGCMVHVYSTGGTLDENGRPKLKELAREMMPKMDWLVIVDTDEFLLLSDRQLQEEYDAGTTIIRSNGVSMVCMSPHETPVDVDVYAINTGYPDINYSKAACYRPDKVSAMNYKNGCHNAKPEGFIKLSKNVYNLYHFHYLGVEFLHKRYRVNDARNNTRGQFARHYSKTYEAIEDTFVSLEPQVSFVLPLHEHIPLTLTGIRKPVRLVSVFKDLFTYNETDVYDAMERKSGVEGLSAKRAAASSLYFTRIHKTRELQILELDTIRELGQANTTFKIQDDMVLLAETVLPEKDLAALLELPPTVRLIASKLVHTPDACRQLQKYYVF